MNDRNKMTNCENTCTFKAASKRKAFLRKRIESDNESDEDGENVLEKIEEMKLLQQLRKKPNGIEISKLLVEESDSKHDAPKRIGLKITGGLVDLKSEAQLTNDDDAYDTGIGTQFSAETNKRDEDEEMMKYIEEQLSKRKKKFSEEDSKAETSKSDFLSPEEAALQALPDHLRVSSVQQSEEMLSNQMLSGIPEVDLGIEVKIKNIEATEEAKLRLLWERQNKADGPSSFVPSNMAVNFVQHNRFNIEDQSISKQEKNELLEKKKKEKRPTEKEPKATDDYHYERFKKQFRRY